jgi:hypothetical protein
MQDEESGDGQPGDEHDQNGKNDGRIDGRAVIEADEDAEGEGRANDDYRENNPTADLENLFFLDIDHVFLLWISK